MNHAQDFITLKFFHYYNLNYNFAFYFFIFNLQNVFAVLIISNYFTILHGNNSSFD